jgi:hypothetical protein
MYNLELENIGKLRYLIYICIWYIGIHVCMYECFIVDGGMVLQSFV